VDSTFRALGDPRRREVLRLLGEGDLSAGELAERVGVAPSTMSGHLRVLREANLVVAERHGTTIVYSLNVSVCEEIVGAVMELFGVGEEGTRKVRDAYGLAD